MTDWEAFNVVARCFIVDGGFYNAAAAQLELTGRGIDQK